MAEITNEQIERMIKSSTWMAEEEQRVEDGEAQGKNPCASSIAISNFHSNVRPLPVIEALRELLSRRKQEADGLDEQALNEWWGNPGKNASRTNQENRLNRIIRDWMRRRKA